MKRIYILLILLLAACVKKDPVQIPSTQRPIYFASPVISCPTKIVTGKISEVYPTAEEFAVYALYTPGDFVSWDAGDAFMYMDDMKASYNAVLNGWSPETTTYWPGSGKLTFTAYSPCEGVRSDADSYSYRREGFVFENFKIQDDPSAQYDLLYSTRAMNRISSADGGAGVYNGADLNFVHALSSIEFRVRNGSNYAGSEIYVKNITILNAYTRGTFLENINTTDESVYTSSPEWINLSDENTSGYKVAPTDLTQQVIEESKALEGARDLLLMPQPFEHPSTSHNVVIRIEYYKGAVPQAPVYIDLRCGYDSDNDGVGDTYFNDGTNVVTRWAPGKKYTYTITFGDYKIFFTPSVTEWSSNSRPPAYI